jgi:hypothetical protein
MRAAPLVRFPAPAALSSMSSPPEPRLLGAHRGALPARYVPSSGFRTLSTACSSTACPALFRAGALLEFHALQSFSLVRSRSASRRPLPSCHSPPPPSRPAYVPEDCSPRDTAARTGGIRVWLQGFAPRSESVAKTAGLSAAGSPDALLGFGPLQGLALRPCADVLPRGSSHELSVGARCR